MLGSNSVKLQHSWEITNVPKLDSRQFHQGGGIGQDAFKGVDYRMFCGWLSDIQRVRTNCGKQDNSPSFSTCNVQQVIRPASLSVILLLCLGWKRPRGHVTQQFSALSDSYFVMLPLLSWNRIHKLYNPPRHLILKIYIMPIWQSKWKIKSKVIYNKIICMLICE